MICALASNFTGTGGWIHCQETNWIDLGHSVKQYFCKDSGIGLKKSSRELQVLNQLVVFIDRRGFVIDCKVVNELGVEISMYEYIYFWLLFGESLDDYWRVKYIFNSLLSCLCRRSLQLRLILLFVKSKGGSVRTVQNLQPHYTTQMLKNSPTPILFSLEIYTVFHLGLQTGACVAQGELARTLETTNHCCSIATAVRLVVGSHNYSEILTPHLLSFSFSHCSVLFPFPVANSSDIFSDSIHCNEWFPSHQ